MKNVFRSFVHDPKMAREAIVTANVKLQFVGQDKDKYVGKFDWPKSWVDLNWIVIIQIMYDDI